MRRRRACIVIVAAIHPLLGFCRENGASEGIRTLDVHLGKVMLYQLSYARVLEERG
jgi:hypothetical protein